MNIILTDDQLKKLLANKEINESVVKAASVLIAKSFNRKPIHQYAQEKLLTPEFEEAVKKAVVNSIMDRISGTLDAQIECSIQSKIKAYLGSKFGVIVAELLKVKGTK